MLQACICLDLSACMGGRRESRNIKGRRTGRGETRKVTYKTNFLLQAVSEDPKGFSSCWATGTEGRVVVRLWCQANMPPRAAAGE